MKDLLGWLERKSAWWKAVDQKQMNAKGETTAHYKTYVNNRLQIAVDTVNSEVSLLVDGKTVMPFNKTLAKHHEIFLEYLKEFQSYELSQDGPLKRE